MFNSVFKIVYFVELIIITFIRKAYTVKYERMKMENSRKDVIDIVFMGLNTVGMIIPIVYVFSSVLDFANYSLPAWIGWIGAALFDHPDSFRYPTYWHVRDYGLMTANPFGLSYFKNDPAQRGDFTLRQGAALCSFYRLYIHIGDATEGRVGAKYNDFVHPPEVDVE